MTALPTPRENPSADSPTRKVGRPLDETAEERILQAAMELYALEGWRGVTMSSVAKRASVGKALLYSRFPNASDIIVQAFETFITEPPGEHASIRDLLIAEANRMADLYLSEYSLAVRRALVDAAARVEPFTQITAAMNTRTVLPMRRAIHAAIAKGELPPWTEVTRLLDVIEGAVRMHVFVAPQLSDKIRSGIREYNRRLVDEQLLLLQHLGPAEAEPDADARG